MTNERALKRALAAVARLYAAFEQDEPDDGVKILLPQDAIVAVLHFEFAPNRRGPKGRSLEP